MTESPKILDITTLKDMKDNMGEAFPTLIEYYLEDSETYAKQIASGLESNDIAAIRVASHTLKSSSKQLGAFLLAETSYQIETMARQAEENNTFPKEELQALYSQLAEQHTQTMAELTKETR